MRLRCLLFFLLLFSVALSVAPARAEENFAQSLKNPRVQKAALGLARQALERFLQTGKTLAMPENLPPALKKRAGVIVTIEKKNRIAPRGCRGTLQPKYSDLANEIAQNVLAAATRDPREKPLQKSELKECRISLTIILSIKPIQNLSQHDAARSGLIAQNGNRIGLVLPYEGKDAKTQWKWARAKAGLREDERAQMLEVEAIRFRE